MPVYGLYIIRALLFTAAFSNLTAASLQHVAPRQDSVDPASITPTAQPTDTPDASTTEASATNAVTATDTLLAPAESTGSSSVVEETTSAIPSSSFVESTAPSTTGASSDVASATSSSTPDEPNPLPVPPIITPAVGTAGVILLLSGIIYTVIGIKNRWLYISLSAAYLTSLSVTVLIVYVMKPPVSNAVQGAFFVAAFFTGIIFGALSLIFQEVTEGFGCLLGGFCLSMWFLSLKEGGLITSSTGKAIFVAVMSCAAFALSFSRYTRTHGLIVCTSFAGATIAILGIDCFSRAGLKEFWLYIWGLNADIFPLDTTTYPITRGIRVEIAGNVLIFLFGIISQLKLWKLIKQRRERKDAHKRAEGRRQEQIEEEVGRRIQDDVNKERVRWEAHFGNKADSGLGSSRENVMKTSVSVRETKRSSSESIEMADVSQNHHQVDEISQAPKSRSRDSGIASETQTHSSEPSRRASRNSANLQLTSEKSIHGSSEVEPSSRTHTLNRSSVPPPPAIVPLPIPIPVTSTARLSHTESLQGVPEKITIRRSLSKRLSETSASFRLSTGRNPNVTSISQEALVTPAEEDDLQSSVAATIDGLDEEDLSLPAWSRPGTSMTYNKEMESVEDEHGRADEAEQMKFDKAGQEGGIEDTKKAEIERRHEPTVSGMPHSSNERGDGHDEQGKGGSKTPKIGSRLLNSRPTSTDGNLAEQLPERLSKVALVYRTNEWAKYLGEAEKPDVEDLPEPESPGVRVELGFQESSDGAKEAERETKEAVPEETPVAKVNEHALAPAPPSVKVKSRPSSAARSLAGDTSGLTLSRNPSSATVNLVRPGSALSQMTAQGGSFPVLRSTSLAKSEARGLRSSSTPILAQPLVESPAEDIPHPVFDIPRATPSPIPSSTLMGKRESMVKNKPVPFSFHPSNSTPHLSPPPQSDLPAIPSSVVSRIDDMPLSERKQQLLMAQRQMAMSPTPSGRASATSHWTTHPTNFDSHQPKRTSGIDHEEQAARYAKWRASTQEMMAPAGGTGGGGGGGSTTRPGAVGEADEGRRATMLAERRNAEARKQQSEQYAVYRDNAFDTMMRSGDMHELHREVMRRMQANANKNA